MTRPHVVAAADRAAVRDLELLAQTTVQGLRHGLHRSPLHGYSAEFSQYRHYRPGDDLKYVDWKAYARTDRLYSRQFRETSNMGALFVLDASRSMHFGTPRTKFALATAVTAVLGTLVIDQGDATGLLALRAADARAEYLPPRSGRHHLRVFLATLARLAAGGATPIAVALRRAAALMKRRGLVIALSDFYEDEAALTELKRLARMGHDVIVIHTLAPEEIALPRASAIEFEDMESGARVVADVRTLRTDYEKSMQRFLGEVQQSVRSEGLDYLRLMTNEPLEPALRRLLMRRRAGA